MVELKHRSEAQVRQWAEHYIPYLTDLWEELPGVAAEIERWDQGEAIMYIAEWPLYEDQRKILNAYAADGVLTADQRAHLDKVNRLSEQYKPTLDWLLNGRKTR